MAFGEYLLIVEARVEPTVEAAWNEWYNDVHVPEILACPGFRESARYVHVEEGGPVYVAVYEIDGPQALETPEFARGRGWGPFAGKVRHQTRVFRRIAAAKNDRVA